MSLLAIEKTINSKNFIKLSRPLMVGDVDITSISHFPETHRDVSSRTYSGANITLKQETIASLIELAKISVRDSGNFVNSNALGGITDAWNAKEPTKITAMTEELLRYNGRRTDESKKVHLKNQIDTAKARWESEKDILISEALVKLQDLIERFLNKHNEEITDMIRNVIVNQNIDTKWFDDNLTTDNKNTVSDNEVEIKAHEAEIEKLREKIKAKKDQNYSIKRDTVEKSILSYDETGDQTKACIESLKDEKPENKMGLFNY